MSVRVGGRYIIGDPGALIENLLDDGWRVVGPLLIDDAIVYGEITDARDLPRGLIDEQSGGHYRLRSGRSASWFEYVVGPQSWKKWLFPARQKLWSARKEEHGFEIEEHSEPWPKTTFLGVRACEIAAMCIQDKVFDNGAFSDPTYKQRRENTLIVAVQCTRSASTCFCASMDTGPKADANFDIALTELGEAGDDSFLVECGSDHGAELLGRIDLREPEEKHLWAAQSGYDTARNGQTRRMVDDAPQILRDALEHSRWDEVANRCLSCANCTMACPTCFCSDVEDVSNLTGDNAERWRVWDSCFTAEFSYIHGGSVRRSTRSRYRQWMTHKLSTWHDQFGSSGCVGCGRCITWCPVGIDITEEAVALATGPSEKNG